MRRSALFMVCTGLSVLSAVLGGVLAVVAWQRAGLPYNEEGQYFDGLVNYQQQSVLVYTVLALAALLLALGLAWLALKTRRPAP
jgi:cytochrome bd-type quinol oxidase subunit 2